LFAGGGPGGRGAGGGWRVGWPAGPGGPPPAHARTAYWPVTILVQLRVSRRWLRWS
jgi:hypothetical protein